MASAALNALVRSQAPTRPYCSETKYGAHIRSQTEAFASPFLQLNPPAQRAWMVFDIDRPGAMLAWEIANLAVPTFVAVNPENGHAHVAYALSAPVCTTKVARLLPLRYLAAIEYAYKVRIKGDFSFSGGPLTKNPLHPHWRVWEPANAPTYELGDLAEFVELPKRLPPKPAGVGRNCELFDQLRRWSYSAVRGFWRPGGEDAWQGAVREMAESLNTFDARLVGNEVKGIARSVARHVWRRFSPQGFSQVQAARGHVGGVASGAARLAKSEDKRASAHLMSAKGMSVRAIAAELEIGKSTVARWLSREAISSDVPEQDSCTHDS